MVDFYETLGVSRTATQEEIKRAYYAKSRLHHPDKIHDPALKADATEKIQKINKAYEVLSDENKRRDYDQYGEEGPPTSHGVNINDLFSMFGGGARQPSMPMIKHRITLAQAINGGNIIVPLAQQVPCTQCDATGYIDKMPHMCASCNGQGRVNQPILGGMMQIPCNRCMGTGRQTGCTVPTCLLCNGSGKMTKSRPVTVTIPPTFFKNPAPVILSDLQIAIQLVIQSEPDKFSIDGHTIVIPIHITLTEALAGFVKNVTLPTLQAVTLVSTRVIQPDSVKCIPGYGMPMGDGPNYQAMFKIIVEFPTHLIDHPLLPLTKNHIGKLLGQSQENSPPSFTHVIQLDTFSDEDEESSTSAPTGCQPS